MHVSEVWRNITRTRLGTREKLPLNSPLFRGHDGRSEKARQIFIIEAAKPIYLRFDAPPLVRWRASRCLRLSSSGSPATGETATKLTSENKTSK